LRVHNIQRFCLHDGPGIRTTVFMQGCNLRCWWCHNPGAVPVDGAAQEWLVPELVCHLVRDARYWRRSGGGVTFSGGEPLLQWEPLAACLHQLRAEGVHVAVETAGAVPLSQVQRLAGLVDLWLWDLKVAEPSSAREVLGVLAALPLGNLRWLLQASAAPVRVRIPIIPGVNTSASQLAALAAAVSALPRRVDVELLRGHDTGRAPGEVALRSAQVSGGEMKQAREVLAAFGLTV
jgi:pyruvate formate lyase activating enzyme